MWLGWWCRSAGLRSASGIVEPAFLALMIVITIHPLLAWLQRHRVPGGLAVALTMLVAYAACWRWDRDHGHEKVRRAFLQVIPPGASGRDKRTPAGRRTGT